jgi:hypothetical protein
VSPHEAIDRDFDAHLERIREFLRSASGVAAHAGWAARAAATACATVSGEPRWARETTRVDSHGSARSNSSPSATERPPIRCASGSGRPARAVASACSNAASRAGSPAVLV